MKKKILSFILFISTVVLIFADQIDDNKTKINQIDSQINKNTQKINQNKGEINKAKSNENTILFQVKDIDKNIRILQSEYDDAEKKYISILKAIGQNDEQIQNSITEINKQSEIITVTKGDLYKKIKVWDKIRRSKQIVDMFSGSNIVEQSRRQHDLKVLLARETAYIQVVKEEKQGVEGEKTQVENIKAENEAEAAKVESARSALESKNKELNAAKKAKNVLISQLRTMQKTLSTENNKIEKNNSQLISEKKRLEAQIQAIIARAIKEREIAMQKAAEEKRRRSEEERLKKEQEAAKAQGETNNTDLAGKKPTSPSTSTQPPTASSNTSVPIYEAPKGTGNLIMPLSGSIVVSFGQEKIAGLRSNGIEIRGSLGQTIKAADSGTVIYAGALNNLGSVIIIDHGNLVTVYGNLAGVSVSKGSKVSKGQSIGNLGRDSISKEPNLYFETRKGVNIVNPMSYL
ncbi:MAG: peptidoglycan DD-metalloendopeptidase family protein [Clostridia bacterium]|jgi:septal ring factor EnvC (AmiA/AmiB activator)|nr:peptidoglycan DD-metalloendopeptidase family protein [Clostridia bacterium]